MEASFHGEARGVACAAAVARKSSLEKLHGNLDGISEDEIRLMLQSMIKQRRESIALYEKGGRLELAEEEAEEIEIIQRFLPAPLGDEEMAAAISGVIAEAEAKSLKDMGRVMAALKERYAGRMDFAKASATVKKKLG